MKIKRGIIQKVRAISVEDKLWLPFRDKHDCISLRIRELIKKDLEEGII